MGSFKPRKDDRPPIPGPPPVVAPPQTAPEDEELVARYRYMLQNAPPEAIEAAHTEAFSRMSPEQRQAVLREMAHRVEPDERPASDDPHELARAATRAEMRQPGFMEGAFGGVGLGGGSLLSNLAGAFIGTAVFNQIFGGGMMGGMYGGPFGGGVFGPFGYGGGFGYPMGGYGVPMGGGYGYMDDPNLDPGMDSASDFDQGGGFGPGPGDYNQDPLGDPGDLGM